MRAVTLAAPLALLLALLGMPYVARAARPSSSATLTADAGGAAATATVQPTAASAPKPPRFPGSYAVRYNFSLPYTAKLQPNGIRYPVAFYRDEEAKSVRMDTYDSTTVLISTKDATYEVVPRIDRQICMVMGGGDEPTRQSGTAGGTEEGPGLGLGLGGPALMDALPDVHGWEFEGDGVLANGQATHVWQYTARHAAKTVVYRLHVSADAQAVPQRLHMQGNDLFSGAHFDEYIVDYLEYTPGRPDPKVFAMPRLCKGVKAQPAPAGTSGRTAFQMRMAAVVPVVAYRGGDTEYDAFLAAHGTARQHRSLEEYRRRVAIFSSHSAMIEAHNARADATFEMAMNKFGDYSQEEFVEMMLPKRARRLRRTAAAAAQQAGSSGALGESDMQAHEQQRKLKRHEIPYEPLARPDTVPARVSWRGTPADGLGPMDQATCGSCWAFSAAGAMEGAWQRATGQRVSFSEQQIVDCSWGFVPGDPESNLGCDGGNHWAAIGYVVDAGGIAQTADYQYKGQDGYCMTNTTKLLGKFKGYARVPRHDDGALREALYSRGPVAISFDAGQPSFRFYSSGVYREERCGYKPSELDHDILLVGYGSSPEGDYWEVKNSWSEHWGDGGYFKVAVDNHACGVTTDAVYAVVADSV